MGTSRSTTELRPRIDNSHDTALKVLHVARNHSEFVHQRRGASRYRYATYTEVRVSLARWASQTVRVVIGAGDVGRASLVEVAVDDVRIERR
jgi:hypothetical protein